jgi:Fe2+ or Zn2+ uptake regulation protein
MADQSEASVCLGRSDEAMTTADLRRCLSTVSGQDVVRERIYRNLEVLEKRGEVARTTPDGRHTLWRLTRPQPAGFPAEPNVASSYICVGRGAFIVCTSSELLVQVVHYTTSTSSKGCSRGTSRPAR